MNKNKKNWHEDNLISTVGNVYMVFFEEMSFDMSTLFYSLVINDMQGPTTVALDSLLFTEISDGDDCTKLVAKNAELYKSFLNNFKAENMGSFDRMHIFALTYNGNCLALADAESKNFEPFFFNGFVMEDLNKFYDRNKDRLSDLPQNMKDYCDIEACKKDLENNINEGSVRKLKL